MKEMNEYTYNTIKEVPLSAMMSTIHRHHSIYINTGIIPFISTGD